MGKRNGKQNRTDVRSSNPNNVTIDYDKLTEAIIKAYKEIRKDEEIEKIRQEEIAREEWYKILGCKKCPDSAKWLERQYFTLRNSVMMLRSATFFKKENVKDPRVAFNFLRQLLWQIFGLCEWGLYVLGVAVFLLSVGTQHNLALILYTVMIVLFARIFRIIKFEVDNIKDNSLLISFFSAITSLVAMIISIVAFFKV